MNTYKMLLFENHHAISLLVFPEENGTYGLRDPILQNQKTGDTIVSHGTVRTLCN